MDKQMELAEAFVYEVLEFHTVNTEEISDTGTVENMMNAGIPLAKIASGKATHKQVLDNICWLDDSDPGTSFINR